MYDMTQNVPPMNYSDLFAAQNLGMNPTPMSGAQSPWSGMVAGNTQPVAQPQTPQMPQQMPPEINHLNDVIQQYTQNKQNQDNNSGLVQQILSQRLQPSLEDASQSTAQTAQSFLAPHLFSPITPDQAMAERYKQQLAPYAQGLGLANQNAELTGRLIQNNVQQQTALPTAMAEMQIKQIAAQIQQQTGLPMAQAELQARQISNQYAPQIMGAEVTNKNITNQYLPQTLQAEIDAKKAQAALAMGSNIFASPMGSQAGFGAGAAPDNTPFPTGGMSVPGSSGQVAPANNNQQGQPQQSNGDAFLQRLTPQAAAQVKALAEGRMAFPSGFALKTPYWQNMLSAVSQYDPNFDAVNYNARAATRKSFTSGADANNIAALNTAMAHLSTLQDAYQTLGNSDIPYYNQAVNFMGNAVGDKTIQANTANVSADAEAVSHELAKVFRSTGMSEGEIDAWKNKISTSAAPAQSTALINSALNLMDGRLQALGAKYNQGMGTTADPIQLLSPQAQAAYTKLRGAGAQGQKIKVSSPDGTVGTIDPAELQDALKNGWKQVQ